MGRAKLLSMLSEEAASMDDSRLEKLVAIAALVGFDDEIADSVILMFSGMYKEDEEGELA